MMKNESKGIVLVSQTVLVNNPFQKMKGLMFSKPLQDQGMAFPFRSMRRRGIHTLFVRFPIDVLFLDEEWKIVEMVKEIQPNSFYRPEAKAQYVVELPKGSIAKGKCQKGDVVTFAESEESKG